MAGFGLAMVALLALTLLAQPGPGTAQTVVLPFTRHEEYPPDKDLALAVRISRLLAAQGVAIALAPDQVDPTLARSGGPGLGTCEGDMKCVSHLGELLHVPAVVALDAAQVGTELAVHLDVLASEDGRRLAKQGFVVPASPSDAQLGKELRPFAEKLVAALGAFSVAGRPAPPLVLAPDAPVAQPKPELTPASPGATVASAPGPGTSPYVLGGGAVLLGLGAGALALVAGIQQGNNPYQLSGPTGEQTSPLTLQQASSKADQINGLYTASLVTAIVAAVLAVGAVYFWTAADPADALPVR